MMGGEMQHQPQPQQRQQQQQQQPEQMQSSFIHQQRQKRNSIIAQSDAAAAAASSSSTLNSSSEWILITDHKTAANQRNGELNDSDSNGSRGHSSGGGGASDDDRNSLSLCTRHTCSRKMLRKRLPILNWLPKYTLQDAICDLIAGITVSFTVIPQGLAYSDVAGLPTEFGLYGSFMGCFMYVLFGTSKDSTVGSTAIASLLTFQFAQGVWQRAVLLTFLTGCIELLMAIFRLGFLVDFVSGPVSAGFTSAVTLIICTSQIRSMIGVQSEGATFLQRWISIIKNIHTISFPDTILGLICIILLILMRYIGRVQIGLNITQRWYHRVVNKLFWFFGVTRSATVVVGFSIWAYYLEMEGKQQFRLTGFVPGGVPQMKIPPFSIEAVPGNVTLGIPEVKGETFLEMVQHMGSGLVIVPLIALLENISVCKNFAKGKPVDVTQELIAMGMANIGISFFTGYRANGGLARSAVNNASGVRTPLSNFYIGSAVVLALMYSTEYFYYIPKAVLAATLIGAVIFQLQYSVVIPMWRSKRTDLIPGFVAFFACLALPLEIGILIAIGINLLFILYHSARPKIMLERLTTIDGQRFVKLTPDRCLVFPSVEFVRNSVLKCGTKTDLPVVIDCTYVYSADYTAAQVISSMVSDFKRRHQQIIFFNLKPSVVNIFEGLNTKLIICYNVEDLARVLRGGANNGLKDVTVTNPNTPTVAQLRSHGGSAGAVVSIGGCYDNHAMEVSSTASTATLTKF